MVDKDGCLIYLYICVPGGGLDWSRICQKSSKVCCNSISFLFLLTEGKAENFTFIFVTFFNAGTLWQYNTKGAIIGKLSKGKGFVFVLLQVITFIDLAGHERYLKTTIFGMTGHVPDFAMLMVRCHIDVQ